jgi:Ca2+-transporting ATPase
MAKDALRVLAYAYKEVKEEKKYTVDKTEKGLIFMGLIGMIDPPRKEAKQAIKTCESAHIRVIMITGDHALTAKAIGKELGLLKEGSKSITGAELAKLSDHEFDKIVEEVAVYARVNPEHKVRIVEALKKKGHVVAMTGDGVNDAPALRKADIGTAMGITGTDVSKEAADMILADDNFVSIVSAVEEGRAIYNNIRKFIRYLLSCNAGEIFVIFASMLLNLPLPLIPLQILWIRHRDEPAVTQEMSAFIIIVGLIMMIGTLGMFAYQLGNTSLIRARTISFTTLVMFQMFVVLNCRSRSFPLYKLGFFTNKQLLIAILSSIVLQFGVIYVPFFQGLFKTVALTLGDWISIIAVSASIFFIIEIKKMIVKAYVIK